MDRIPRDRPDGGACGRADIMRPVVGEGVTIVSEKDVQCLD